MSRAFPWQIAALSRAALCPLLQAVRRYSRGWITSFKYNFVTFGRWVPYLDAGAGLLWSDLPRALKYGPPFNFVLQVGSGLQYFVSPNYALTLGLRFHHISNAGTGERNIGLNGILAYIGIVLFRSQ